MNLTPRQKADFAAECSRGRLFFWSSYTWTGKVNHWYQRRVRKDPQAKLHFDHVGIVGDEQGAYESMLWSGPSRNRSIRRYLDMAGHLVIAEVVFEEHPITDVEIDFGMAKLIRAIQLIHDRSRGLLTYDWISLVSFGRLQANNRMICSELAAAYLDEALRERRRWTLHRDNLVLPDDLLGYVRVVWDSNKDIQG